ncbi:MAG: hypothetical protein NUW07_06550, partial [Candidatus Saccharicenans sp.]|nr:hypothetical protein [Candidatus Saccharicenans sp.]
MKSTKLNKIGGIIIFLIIAAAGVLTLAGKLRAQKVEVVDGLRLVHNKGKGAWGKKPALILEPVRKLGDIDSTDPNTAFYMPAAVA